MDDLLLDFLTEANESLSELDVALVKFETIPDDAATLSQIFRLVHTIKGTCGFLGLPRLERVAHAGESVLGRMRDGKLAASPEAITLILSALDRIKEIIAGLAATAVEPTGDDGELIAALNAMAAGETVPAGAPPAPAAAVPPAAEAALLPREETAAVASAPPEKPTNEAAVGAQTIRVAVDVLEDLMTLVSELVLTRNQLLQLVRTQENSPFAAPLQRLSHITTELQEGVMKTRMQPIGMAWNKLPRLVRDLSRELGKKIELTMIGAETELDRQVIELIKDPLTHMVRNSADHGLESPPERRGRGKAETGRITLSAYHVAGHIVIEIADDGRGLPVEKIRARAIAQGLAGAAELAGMSDSQIQSFIFLAGFSTATGVTAVSGRGVGMDVVRTNIEKIGGAIDLKSADGQGTTFTLKIPLTLAIVSALIVEAGGERFAIPQISVLELVLSGPGAESRIERINATPVLRLRDQLLPLVSLTALLRLEETAAAMGEQTIVVTQVGASMIGLIVDRVFDTEEIVVKPVAPILRAITMFAGNTILGDGSVVMILDPNGIARASGIGTGAEDRPAVAGTTVAAQSSSTKVPMLLFRAGGPEPKAVPLALVARLEDVPREKIEFSAGMPVTQYRGQLMPLISLSGGMPESRGRTRQPVLVFADRDRRMGLMVDEIVDVVEDHLRIELTATRPGYLGTAVIACQATEVIDTGYWLTEVFQDWFRNTARVGRSVLVVEDSDFFRQILTPSLIAVGFEVTQTNSAAQALKLREAGAMFDAVISDIEMPEMDGLDLVRRLREGGAWKDLPIIALSAAAEPEAIAAGRAAGFTDYVAKFDRDGLLRSLRQCLAARMAS